MADERITVLNPNTGRDNGTISVRFHRPVRAAILEALADHDGLHFGDLSDQVEQRTPSSLWDGASPGWYTTSVKLDLEARGLIEREGSPQRLHLTEAGRVALVEIR